MQISDDVYVDGSWELTVVVEDLQLNRRIRVRGDSHVGGLMMQLVESIDVRMDWSDHALWWPERNVWLLKTRHTLDQCGLQANTQLEFHRMHNCVQLLLPDLQERELVVSFAKSVFAVTVGLCKELGIRHPEELSLMRSDRASGVGVGGSGGGVGFGGGNGGSGTLFRSLRRSKSKTPDASPSPRPSRRGDAYSPLVSKPTSPGGGGVGNGFATIGSSRNHLLLSPNSINSLAFEGVEQSLLANSPQLPTSVAFAERGVQRARTFAEKVALSECWLDSSKSLMQQRVRPNDELKLRWKYHAYYDLNVKYDAIRINLIFEQAKWSVLSEEVDCTDEEMLALAALQLQVRQAAEEQRFGDVPDGASSPTPAAPIDAADAAAAADDEIDAALADLERSLLNDTPADRSQLQHVPELTGHLKIFKPKRLTLKQYKKYFCRLKETTLVVQADAAAGTAPLEQLSLKGAEVAPDVNVGTQRYGIRLFLLGAGGGLHEIWLRCETKQQYAEWVAGLRLAARGRTLASRSQFDTEVKETLGHLELQSPKRTKLSISSAPDLDVTDFVSHRLLKRHKPQHLLLQILERQAQVKDRSLLDTKLDYIRMWQRLPSHGIAYFMTQYSEARTKPLSFNEFRKEKQQKFELIGISFNKISRIDPVSGDALNTWRYHELGSWTVNWEVNTVSIQLNRPPHEMVLTPVPSAASTKATLCKTLVEFIGGYVFLSLRQPERSQELDERMFHKLTGSRDVA